MAAPKRYELTSSFNCFSIASRRGVPFSPHTSSTTADKGVRWTCLMSFTSLSFRFISIASIALQSLLIPLTPYLYSPSASPFPHGPPIRVGLAQAEGLWTSGRKGKHSHPYDLRKKRFSPRLHGWRNPPFRRLPTPPRQTGQTIFENIFGKRQRIGKNVVLLWECKKNIWVYRVWQRKRNS